MTNTHTLSWKDKVEQGTKKVVIKVPKLRKIKPHSHPSDITNIFDSKDFWDENKNPDCCKEFDWEYKTVEILKHQQIEGGCVPLYTIL